MCPVSRVNCYMSLATCQEYLKKNQIGGVSCWRVCYQQGLPCLVLTFSYPKPADTQYSFNPALGVRFCSLKKQIHENLFLETLELANSAESGKLPRSQKWPLVHIFKS